LQSIFPLSAIQGAAPIGAKEPNVLNKIKNMKQHNLNEPELAS
jgi:hypothetical protein